MRKYEHLFFDLDGTLWDIHKNAELTLLALFDQLDLHHVGFDAFMTAYLQNNKEVWSLYRQGKMDKETLRHARFSRSFADLGHALPDEVLMQFSYGFTDQCPLQPHLLPHAMEILQHVFPRYSCHIITNGFKEVQGIKMSSSGLHPFFNHVILSEDVGVNKPNPLIFHTALEAAGATVENSLMIGDDWEADMVGAKNVGMDHVYLDLDHHPLANTATYRITSLHELKQIL
jgi:putative hydrolase of the HAD superfamily